MLQRGTCPFRAKAQNAQQAGAAAAVIFDQGQPGALAGTLGGPGITIPVLAMTPAVARQLTGDNAGRTQARGGTWSPAATPPATCSPSYPGTATGW